MLFAVIIGYRDMPKSEGRLAQTVAGPVVVDTSDLLDCNLLRRAGFSWVGLGVSGARSRV